MPDGPDELHEIIAKMQGLAERPLTTGPAPGSAGGGHHGDGGRSRLPARPAPHSPARDRPLRTGLVLAGGAAKGAYEVGVLDFLVQQHISVAAIAGTSIGALNGALLASAPTIADGAAEIRRVWDAVAARFGDLTSGGPYVSTRHEPAGEQARNLRRRIGAVIRERGFLEEVARRLDPARIRAGRPVWVAAYPMLAKDLLSPPTRHVIELLRAAFRDRSRLLRLNDMADGDIRNAVLASAALPYLLPSRTVAGQRYRDGWIGGENVPVAALVREEHCECVIVVHLDRVISQRWDTFGPLRRVDIVPSEPLTPPGPLGMITGLLDFSPKRSAYLRELGYRDAVAAFHETVAPVVTMHGLRASEADLLDALRWLRDTEPPGWRDR